MLNDSLEDPRNLPKKGDQVRLLTKVYDRSPGVPFFIEKGAIAEVVDVFADEGHGVDLVIVTLRPCFAVVNSRLVERLNASSSSPFPAT